MVDTKFFDSLIFFSLIITFALILLLVYYFKQRISALEQRSDSLFDIINTLVKQMQLMQVGPKYLGEKSTPENASIRAYDNTQQYVATTPVSENKYLTENIYLEKAEEGDSLGDSYDESKSESESESESDDDDDDDEEEALPQLETTKIIHVDLP